MEPIDLDHQATWPSTVLAQLACLRAALIAERTAIVEHLLSDDHWITPSPPTPATDAALETIRDEVARRSLRVFHATRLTDPNEVRASGLRPLDFQERFDQLRQLSASGPLRKHRKALLRCLEEVDLTIPFYASRPQKVWFSPLRRSLHDGGCDDFFSFWGGEAVERILSLSSPELGKALKGYGKPAVVVANIPAFGWCFFSDTRLPETMLDLFLEATGEIEVPVASWDVLIKRPIPAKCIECIVDPTDTHVTWPLLEP